MFSRGRLCCLAAKQVTALNQVRWGSRHRYSAPLAYASSTRAALPLCDTVRSIHTHVKVGGRCGHFCGVTSVTSHAAATQPHLCDARGMPVALSFARRGTVSSSVLAAAPAAESGDVRSPSQEVVASSPHPHTEAVAGAGGHHTSAYTQSAIEREVIEAIEAIRSRELKQHDAKFNFVSNTTYVEPMVMLLGNHSCGKSSFINYLTGRSIQETGIAPTDDGFTIIRRGDCDLNDDGPTAVSNPQFQFENLQQFGSAFVHRFRVKTRRLPASSPVSPNMVLVDTPGMIDTPVHVANRTSFEGQLRGYDFLAVTRWFAQRSDVILLIFDPANPGTTGETLDVLTKSLAGFEHKLLLVLNKVDVFEKSVDFARAYGTLCWNLSKIISMKDIPRIYTTCTPLGSIGEDDATRSCSDEVRRSAAPDTADTGAAEQEGSHRRHDSKSEKGTVYRSHASVTIPSAEIDRQRLEVIQEVMAAPLRRLDNIITETEESAKCVLLAHRVCTALRRRYRQRVAAMYAAVGVTAVAVPAVIYAMATLTTTGMAVATAGSMLLTLVGLLWVRRSSAQLEQGMLKNLDDMLGQLYVGALKSKDLEMRWQHVVKPEIVRLMSGHDGVNRSGIANLPYMSRRAYRRIERILRKDVPELRVKVSDYKRAATRRHTWGIFTH